VSAGNKQHQLKVSQLLSDLNSGNETKIASAIKAFHVHGDATVILPLVKVWQHGLSSENEALMMELFVGLKDSTCIPALMEVYRNAEFHAMKRKLTAAFWNSKLDFSEYLSDFVLYAIEGDFLDAFEAITLIEQFESSISESAVMESQLLLKEYFGESLDRSSQKDIILSDLALVLKQIDEESGTEDLFLD
jgi:hypothetical protein